MVRTAVNRWLSSDALSTRYQLRIRTLGAIDAMEQPLADAIEGLPIEQVSEGSQPGVDSAGHEYDGELPGFGVKNPQAEAQSILKTLRERVGEKYDELVLLDLRSNTPVTHRDVGIGISQVLPVLVHAYADAAKIVAIEQPEIHLHPALQAELGDVFITTAISGVSTPIFAVRRMKIELLVSVACSSSMTGSNSVEERLAMLQPALGQVGRHAAGRNVGIGQPRPAKLLEKAGGSSRVPGSTTRRA